MQSPVESSAFASGAEAGGLHWNLNQSLLEFAVVPFSFPKCLLKVHPYKLTSRQSIHPAQGPENIVKAALKAITYP